MSLSLHAPNGLNKELKRLAMEGEQWGSRCGVHMKNSIQLYRLENATKLFQVYVGNFEASMFHENLSQY
jgi:hypothetical protein